jgi:hypothetical protein
MTNLIQFDKRATHRIFSEPVALDVVNDVQALSDEAIRYLEKLHWIALGTGDEHLVKGIAAVHHRVMGIRDRANVAAGLVEDSIVVNPYVAVEYAALEVAA